MTNNKIINLGDPTDDKDAVNKQCLEQLKDKKKKNSLNQVIKRNQFDYLMKNTLEWSDLISGGNSFNTVKIGDCEFHKLNPD